MSGWHALITTTKKFMQKPQTFSISNFWLALKRKSGADCNWVAWYHRNIIQTTPSHIPQRLFTPRWKLVFRSIALLLLIKSFHRRHEKRIISSMNMHILPKYVNLCLSKKHENFIWQFLPKASGAAIVRDIHQLHFISLRHVVCILKCQRKLWWFNWKLSTFRDCPSWRA